MNARLLILPALLLAVTPRAGADSWPGFRGPTADGRAASRNPVTTWSEKEHVLWKAEVHGKGWSSPVVLGDQVWVTTADEVPDPNPAPPPKKGGAPANPVKEVHLFAVCLDRATGNVVRDIKLGTIPNPPYCHPFNSYASCTPFVEPGRLYAHFGSLGTWCVDTATGKVLWERRDLECDHYRGPASSPVVYGDLLYLTLDGFDTQYVTALDKKTGDTVWKTDRNIKYSTDNGDFKKAYATPALFAAGGREVLVCPSAECTVAYDPKTGAERWRVAHGGMNGAARPVMGRGLIYLTSGHNGRLLAVKADASPDASGFLTKEAVAWAANKNVPTRPSLLLDGDLLFAVSDQGLASCWEAGTGKVLWSERLDGEFSASPVLAGGRLYCCNQSGKVFVLAAGKTFDVLAENRLEDGFMASPAVVDDVLYLRTKKYMYAIGKK
jgi:outer membrane protein assembly factor BamB